jgi:hypothetical protein
MDFQTKNDGFNVFGTKILHENVKCYESQQIMKHTDINFIMIFNKFEQHHKPLMI